MNLKNKSKRNHKKFLKKYDNQNILKQKINSLQNSLDNFVNIKKANKKSKEISMDNKNLSIFSNVNENNKNEVLSNLNINNLDNSNNNNKNIFENLKNNLNNTESITIDDNISFFSPKKNLKMNSFLQNNQSNNQIEKNNEKDINNNHNKFMRRSTVFKTINYQTLKKNPNYISSSNDQISTDTNLVNNKNYSIINNTTTDIVQFNTIKKKSTNFHNLLHQNIKKKMDEFEKKVNEQQKTNYPILLLRTDKKSKSNREKNFNFLYHEHLKKNKTKSEDEKNILNNFFEKRKIFFYNQLDGNSKFSNFKTILSSPKKKNKLLNYNIFSLEDTLSPMNNEIIDENLKNSQRNSKQKIMKNFKKQLSKIPEISLLNESKRKNTSSFILLEPNIEHLKDMKEIIEHKIENFKEKRNLTPIQNKGYKIFKKLIDKIEKKIIEIDASFSNSSKSEKSERKSTVSLNNTFNFKEFRTNSVRLSIRELQCKINKDFIDVKKKKLIEFLSNNIKDYDDDIDLDKVNFVEKIIFNTFQILYKNITSLKKRNSLISINKKNDKYEKEYDNYFKEINEKSLNKFEIRIIKLINPKNLNIQNITPFYYNQIILKNHFKINLYDQIMKGRFLETDLGNKESDIDNLLYNFEKNQKKTIKAIRKFNHQINISNNLLLSNISFQFYNNFLILDGKEIDNIDSYDEDYNKEIYYTFNRKRYHHDRLVRYNYTYNNQTNKENSSSHFHPSYNIKPRNSIKYNKGRLSLKNTYLKNTIINNLKSFEENNKCKILKKEFFKRRRNSFENELIFQRKRNNKYKRNLTLRKKHKTLYISPNTLNNEYKITHRGTISLRGYDKEMNLFKTMKIKHDLLKKCKNYTETLFLYIKHSDYHNFIKIFERIKPNPNILDKDGNSLLNLAVQCDSKNIVNYLLCKGADPNTQNNKLNSPLHYALIYQNFEIADLLIKYGAYENLKNGDGLTAWQCLNSQNTLI